MTEIRIFIEVAQGERVAFTIDNTKFTDEMKHREFKFIRKKLKKSIKQISVITGLPEAALNKFERQKGNETCRLRIPPHTAKELRKLVEKAEQDTPIEQVKKAIRTSA